MTQSTKNMKEYYIEVGPNVDRVVAKLVALGYHSREPWNSERGKNYIDCVYTYADGKYAFHYHKGSNTEGSTKITLTQLFALPTNKEDMTQLKRDQIVLYRDHDDQRWLLAQLGDPSPLSFKGLNVNVLSKWNQVIPFEGNEHLAGTTDAHKPVPQIGEWWLGYDRANGLKRVLLYDKNRTWVQAANWATCFEEFIPVHKMVEAWRATTQS